MREWYAAVRDKRTGEVFAAVYLVDCRKGKGGCNFGWKSMDKTCGPDCYNCPARILDLLSPTDSEYALKWRKKCRETLQTKQSLPKVKDGDIIRFPSLLRFTDGTEADTFVVRFKKHRVLFYQQTNGVTFPGAYRISKWRDRGYELVQPPTAKSEVPKQMTLFA